ncbi:MAG: CoA transferase subunit A [Myxococcota bacterium]
MNKVLPSAEAALADVHDGTTLMSGGFGLCGNPEDCIRALRRKNVKNIHVISNNCGTTLEGLGLLLENGQVRKMTSSYVGENKNFANQFLNGKLEVELNPQGTLAERIRAGGAGIEAFFTPTGVGTPVAEGKEVRDFGGRLCVLETALRADFAIIKAWRGDAWGNLVYRKTAQNFNPIMATAAKITVAEVEELVDVGELDPDQIHTPGIYVQRVIQATDYEKPIEQRTVLKRKESVCH